MKKLYIQPETQLQPMNMISIICASGSGGGRSIGGNSSLGYGGNGTGYDPL